MAGLKNAHAIRTGFQEQDLISESLEEPGSDPVWDFEPEEALAAHHPFTRFENQCVLSGLRNLRNRFKQCPGSQQTSSGQGQLGETARSGGLGHGGVKRDGAEDAENGPNSGPPRDTQFKRPETSRTTESGTKKPLACLFYKRNRFRHFDCANLKLTRVRDVKQHLRRKHRSPQHYCAICYMVFSCREDHDTHARDQNCASREHPNWDGLSEFQSDGLTRRVPVGVSEEEQWFSVWDFVFPGVERPSTAYLGEIFEEVLGAHRECWEADVHGFVSGAVEDAGSLDRHRTLQQEQDMAVRVDQILHRINGALLAQVGSRVILSPAPSDHRQEAAGSETNTGSGNHTGQPSSSTSSRMDEVGSSPGLDAENGPVPTTSRESQQHPPVATDATPNARFPRTPGRDLASDEDVAQEAMALLREIDTSDTLNYDPNGPFGHDPMGCP